MAFTITPTSYTELLHFLDEKRMPYWGPSSDVLATALQKEIGHPLLTPALLESLGISYIVECMDYTVKTSAFIDSVRDTIKLPSGSLYRRCSSAFKGFCGSENLTSSGCISRDAAIDYINAYVARNGLRADGLIHLDESLKSALNADVVYVSPSKLVALAESIFA